MDSLPLHVQSRHSGGRQDHDLPLGPLPEKLEQGGLAGPGPPGDKDILPARLHQLQRPPELPVDLDCWFLFICHWLFYCCYFLLIISAFSSLGF
jgi:hypothetical protein